MTEKVNANDMIGGDDNDVTVGDGKDMTGGDGDGKSKKVDHGDSKNKKVDDAFRPGENVRKLEDVLFLAALSMVCFAVIILLLIPIVAKGKIVLLINLVIISAQSLLLIFGLLSNEYLVARCNFNDAYDYSKELTKIMMRCGFMLLAAALSCFTTLLVVFVDTNGFADVKDNRYDEYGEYGHIQMLVLNVGCLVDCLVGSIYEAHDLSIYYKDVAKTNK